MDLTKALQPKSDQLDFADLEGSPPQVFTITDVHENQAELAEQQPVNVRLAEFPRVWRPSKGMLRVMADNWGRETKGWIGRQVELYGDPEVYVGKEKRGGTRISRLSHITAAKKTLVNPRGGRGAYWSVKPLPEQTSPPSAPEPMTDTTRGRLFALFSEHGIDDRAKQLAGIEAITGTAYTSRGDLTEDHARAVIASLEGRAS